MAFDISYVFQAIDKFTRPARAILQSTKRLEGAYNSLNKVAKYGAELQNKSKYVMAGSILAIVGLGASLLHTAGTFQKLNMSGRVNNNIVSRLRFKETTGRINGDPL